MVGVSFVITPDEAGGGYPGRTLAVARRVRWCAAARRSRARARFRRAARADSVSVRGPAQSPRTLRWTWRATSACSTAPTPPRSMPRSRNQRSLPCAMSERHAAECARRRRACCFCPKKHSAATRTGLRARRCGAQTVCACRRTRRDSARSRLGAPSLAPRTDGAS
jgi:hypothetical protein